jgi:hypothetical protein
MREAIPSKKLDFWINHNCNVLLEGKHGVGKTSAVLSAFERHGIKYLYFSCSTLDPWVDFVGIPKEMTDPATGTLYLDLVRPKAFALDEVEVIFLDEMNRAPTKVTNAIMELIQFKSINGKKLSKLRAVWAAINPPAVDDKDPQYHVQELDPAIRTRFQVKYEVPFAIAEGYFEEKYGKGLTERLVRWWKGLPQNIKMEFPPREIEHTLKMLNAGGDISDTLPSCIKKSTFLKAISEEVEQVATVKKPGSGVSQNSNFVNADVPTLKKVSRDRKEFAKQMLKCSNEEVVQLFTRVGCTSSSLLSTIGQRILESCTNDQLMAVSKINLDGNSKFKGATIRTLDRIAAKRKIQIWPDDSPNAKQSDDEDDMLEDDLWAFMAKQAVVYKTSDAAKKYVSKSKKSN